MVYMWIPQSKVVSWERIIVLLSQMVFQANKIERLCSVSEYVELLVE